MILDRQDIQAVVFDYGNTLVEFAAPQIEYCDRQLGTYLHDTFGPYDADRLTELRNIDRRAPYQEGYRENDLAEISCRLVEALYGQTPSDQQVQRMLEVRQKAFVQRVEVEAEVVQLVERLKLRFKIGLLSNYPCGESIRHSLQRIGLEPHIDAVVVSADVGHVKPHPLPFTAVLDQLDVAPAAAIYVGDNWLGDVQGAKRLGMKMAYITQYDTPEKFDRQAGDLDPDITIVHLSELETFLN